MCLLVYRLLISFKSHREIGVGRDSENRIHTSAISSSGFDMIKLTESMRLFVV